MTQTELGLPLYSASYISHLESGRRRPTDEVLAHLADRLGADVVELSMALEPEDDERSESVRLALLQSRARQEWELHDYDVAVAAAGDAAAYAAAHRRVDVWWEQSLLEARARLALEDYERCWTLALELSQHSWATQSPLFASQALVLATKALRAQGVGERAVAVAREAVERSRDLPPGSLERVQALSALISAHAEFANLEAASEAIDELAAQVEHLTERQARAEATWTLGNVAFLRGDVEAGHAYHATTTRHLNPMSDLRAWGRFHKATARMRVLAAFPAHAAEHLDKARQALTLVGNRSDLQELDRTAAELLLLEGEPRRALARLEPLVRQQADIPEHEWARIQLVRVRALREIGEFDEALTCLASAARALARAGAHEQAVEAWEEHADLEQELRSGQG